VLASRRWRRQTDLAQVLDLGKQEPVLLLARLDPPAEVRAVAVDTSSGASGRGRCPSRFELLLQVADLVAELDVLGLLVVQRLKPVGVGCFGLEVLNLLEQVVIVVEGRLEVRLELGQLGPELRGFGRRGRDARGRLALGRLRVIDESLEAADLDLEERALVLGVLLDLARAVIALRRALQVLEVLQVRWWVKTVSDRSVEHLG
jgi:hypothetical protein